MKKKLLALFLVAILAVSLPFTSLAAQTGNLTINGTTDGKTYDLYRVFDLTQSGTNYAYTVNSDFAGYFSSQSPTITDPVGHVEGLSSDAAALSALAQDLLDYAITNSITPAKSVLATGTSAIVTGLDYGYYLLNPLGGSHPSGSYATMFALNTLSGADTEINVKSEYPTIDKKIVEGSNEVGKTSASIGEDITFKLASKVPDTTGYNYYYFLVEDTLSKGLTYTASSVAITIDGTTVPTSAYVVTNATDALTGITTLRIYFKDFQASVTTAGASVGDDIVITYKAVLNEDANIGTVANPNEVTLTYSNDPKFDYNGTVDSSDPGDPEHPGSGTPTTSETPKAETKTYTTSVTINKTDGTNALTGASFRITGTGVKTVITSGDVYTVGASGTYYKLKDGTYTTTAPVWDSGTADDDLYEAAHNKYVKSTSATMDTTVTGVEAEAFVDSSGKLTFAGLGAGTYTITEIVTPIGYNTIPPFDIVITFDPATETFTAKKGSDNLTVTSNKVSLNVVNQSGAVLPGTGGIGTTIFYGLGSLMVLGAGVLLVTKRRMRYSK